MKLKRHFRRFLIVYFFLYTLPFPLDKLPFEIGDTLASWINALWSYVVPIFAKDILGFQGAVLSRTNGSGDSVFFFFLVPTMILITTLICCLWHLLAFKWRSLNRNMFPFFIVYLRYYLAFTMFTYGFAKVFYLQFPELSLFQLTQEFGDASPMGLLWKFMGYSEPYSVFTGLVEVLAGVFLLFRKTKMLGVCLVFATMIQVFMLNMTFDVPVKLYSFHLILITLILLSSHLGRLWDFFITTKQPEPYQTKPYFNKKSSNLWLAFVKYSLIFFVLLTTITDDIARQEKYGKHSKTNVLYGIYEVDIFVRNNDTIEVSRRNPKIWDRLIIDKRDAVVEKMDRGRVGMQMALDSVHSKLALKAYLDENDNYDLSFKLIENRLILSGKSNSDTVTIELNRKNREDYFLEKRGFNWINEYPMNR